MHLSMLQICTVYTQCIHSYMWVHVTYTKHFLIVQIVCHFLSQWPLYVYHCAIAVHTAASILYLLYHCIYMNALFFQYSLHKYAPVHSETTRPAHDTVYKQCDRSTTLLCAQICIVCLYFYTLLPIFLTIFHTYIFILLNIRFVPVCKYIMCGHTWPVKTRFWSWIFMHTNAWLRIALPLIAAQMAVFSSGWNGNVTCCSDC